jgi:hypothetical protein
MFVWLISSHRLAVLFSPNKPATNHQPTVKQIGTSNQSNEQDDGQYDNMQTF